MARVCIKKVGPEVVVEGEGMLMDLANEKNLPIPFGCQSGRCGVCQVEVVEGALADPGQLETAILEGFRCPDGVRLACQAFLDGDVVLRAVND